MNQLSDINLIEGLIKQNPKAQQTMLDRYGQLVFAQVSRLVSGIENAEEVYQDVFIKVFRSIDTYDATKSSLRTWLSRIAYHESISYLRRSSLPLIYYEDREGEAEKLSESEVDATFGQPNPETVQLIRAEMSLKDIAYVTESIPTTVASKLSRTRKKLCKIIKMLQS